MQHLPTNSQLSFNYIQISKIDVRPFCILAAEQLPFADALTAYRPVSTFCKQFSVNRDSRYTVSPLQGAVHQIK